MGKTQNKNSAVKKTPQGKSGFWSGVKEILVIFVCAVILATLIKSFIIDSRIIPSTSMIPTIEVGDRVILWRLAYVFKHEPQRGDIIVFESPAELHESSDLIKRVIGLPGETIEIKNGYVYIDGKALEENYLNERPTYTYGPVTVPEDCYFIMGDNRNISIDSHMWLNPFLSADEIKGKVIFRYWPLSKIGGLD